MYSVGTKACFSSHIAGDRIATNPAFNTHVRLPLRSIYPPLPYGRVMTSRR